MDPIRLGDAIALNVQLLETANGRGALRITLEDGQFTVRPCLTIAARKLPSLIAQLLAAEAQAEQRGWLEEVAVHPRERRRRARGLGS